jgi:GAF domain-containing protein
MTVQNGLTLEGASSLARVERQRSGVVVFLIVIIMSILTLITIVAFATQQGPAVPSLAIVALMACFYAMQRERWLKHERERLVTGIAQRDRQLGRMTERVKEGQQELGFARDKVERLGHRLDEMTRLYRAISTVNSIQHPLLSYEAVIRAGLDLVGGDCGSLMLLDRKERQLVIRSEQGLGERIAEQTRQPLGAGVAGWVAAHDESVLLNGKASQDGRFADASSRAVVSALSIPLKFADQVIGVLNLGCTVQCGKQELTETDRSMGQIFAQHASVTVELSRYRERHG